MHNLVNMDSQITHYSMCVSSIHLQCNLHRHCIVTAVTMHLEPQSYKEGVGSLYILL